MEENYMATTGNGHEPKDMYNPETNTLDIRSNGLYPSNVLSNMCSNGFRFDGMVCGSMEGFLQSLKRKGLDKQRQICSMKGGNARKMSVTSWQTDQIVWWKGQAIDRQSEEYQTLIRFDKRHRDAITRVLDYSHWNRIVLFNKIAFDEDSNVEDPHFQTEAVYRHVAQHIEIGCKRLIERWKLQPPF